VANLPLKDSSELPFGLRFSTNQQKNIKLMTHQKHILKIKKTHPPHIRPVWMEKTQRIQNTLCQLFIT